MEQKHQKSDIKKSIKVEKDLLDLDEGLKAILEEISEYAELVVKDYKNNPSEMSGSMHHISENSPVLKE